MEGYRGSCIWWEGECKRLSASASGVAVLQMCGDPYTLQNVQRYSQMVIRYAAVCCPACPGPLSAAGLADTAAVRL